MPPIEVQYRVEATSGYVLRELLTLEPIDFTLPSPLPRSPESSPDMTIGFSFGTEGTLRAVTKTIGDDWELVAREASKWLTAFFALIIAVSVKVTQEGVKFGDRRPVKACLASRFSTIVPSRYDLAALNPVDIADGLAGISSHSDLSALYEHLVIGHDFAGRNDRLSMRAASAHYGLVLEGLNVVLGGSDSDPWSGAPPTMTIFRRVATSLVPTMLGEEDDVVGARHPGGHWRPRKKPVSAADVALAKLQKFVTAALYEAGLRQKRGTL